MQGLAPAVNMFVSYLDSIYWVAAEVLAAVHSKREHAQTGVRQGRVAHGFRRGTGQASPVKPCQPPAQAALDGDKWAARHPRCTQYAAGKLLRCARRTLIAAAQSFRISRPHEAQLGQKSALVVPREAGYLVFRSPLISLCSLNVSLILESERPAEQAEPLQTASIPCRPLTSVLVP